MKTAIVGATGAVGRELTSLIADQNPILYDSSSTVSFDGVDLAFFCTSSKVSEKLIPKARSKNVICIDASSAFRKNSNVPLVIPEINSHALNTHEGIIASPNCTTTLMLLPLHLLHQRFQIKRIVAATYQAVSGAGYRAIKELEENTQKSQIFPYPCRDNVFVHESKLNPSGYVSEEEKMWDETRKILNDESIKVTARCTRVPVKRVHSMALNVEFAKPLDLEEAEERIKKSEGVELRKTFCALDAENRHSVLCGYIRKDLSQENTLELWIAGDQLLKGAALNMAQIAKALC